MRMRVLGGIFICIIIVALYLALLYKSPTISVTAGEVSYEEFRTTVSVEYGLMMLILCVILSIVMVASVFAFRVSEGIGGGEK